MQSVPSQDEPPRHRGERRRLTVMFCDLVDSSRLADRFDPEKLNDILLDYYRTCETVVRRFDGHVAEERGDGVMIYFGWPIAHEDDAYRAVCTGLGLIEAMQALNARLAPLGVELQVRIGVDTGGVVVGELVDGQKGEHVMGSAPNVAFRLQSIAKPDTVVISGATFGLVRGYFTYEDRGSHNLRNIAGAVHVYRMIAESGAANRLDAVSDRGLTPFIGREPEFKTLVNLWDRAKAGQSQVVQISGEPGIGKSRLVKAISERIAHRIVFRCSQLNSNSALLPVTRALERSLGLDQLEDSAQKLLRLEHRIQGLGFSAGDVALLTSEFSLPLPERDATANVSPQQKRQQILNLFVEWLLREAQQQPLMAVWEDLHWADPSTIELLGLVINRATSTPLLTLMTFRSNEFQPPWTAPSSLTELTLARLERPNVEEMIAKITSGRSLPGEVVDQIVEKTDGVPLFVEELLQSVLDSGFVRNEGHPLCPRAAVVADRDPRNARKLADVALGSAESSQSHRAAGRSPWTDVFTGSHSGGPRDRRTG